MNTIIIYNSKTGFTQRYAKWIQEELDCTCIEFKKAKNQDLSQYQCVIFGSWLMAATIVKLDWFQTFAAQHPEKYCVVFGVGASPAEYEDTIQLMKEIFSTEEFKGFYFQGGLDYDKMKFPHKQMMKMMSKSLQKKKDKDAKETIMAKMLSQSYDESNREAIMPLVEYVKGLPDEF